MRKRSSAGLAAAAAAAVCVGAPAHAATWTVSPGGAVTGTAGTAIATITNVSFNSCRGPLGIRFNVTNNSVSYQLNAVSHAGGVTTGTLDNISATLSGPLCSATVAGTSAATPGTISGTYTNSTHTLSVTGGDLHLWNVSGCLGLLNNGDAVSYTANYVLSPGLTITSP